MCSFSSDLYPLQAAYFSDFTSLKKFKGSSVIQPINFCKANFYTSSLLQTKNESSNDEFKKKEKELKKLTYLTILNVFILIGVYFYMNKTDKNSNNISMSWEEFEREVLPTGEVKRLIANPNSPQQGKFELHAAATFHNRNITSIEVSVPSDKNIKDYLEEAEKKIGIKPGTIPVFYIISMPPQQMFIFAVILLLSSLFTARYLFRNMSNKNMRRLITPPKKQPPLSQAKKRKSPSQDPFSSFNVFKMFDNEIGYAQNTNVKFDDVAGMQEAKQEVMEFVQFLKNPEPYQKLGAKMPRGCLLTGPPGVGKTLLAKAVATEAGVPFIAKAGSDFVEMIGGLGARRIRQLFEKARESAPCIIYIDELDAVGASRSEAKGRFGDSAASEKDQTLNQILVEMDGMLSKQHQVIVLASTNRADILDKALLRPGRFDRVVYIDLPNRIERKQILDRHLKDIKLEEKPEKYSTQIANETPGMSGADLANICNEAAIFAAREGDDIIAWKHLHYAIERVTSGAPKSTTSLSAEERQKVAVHESGHALVGWLLEHTDALAKITIIPRSKGLLGVTRTVQSDRYLHTEEHFFDNMCMALGGRAAEQLIFGHVTQGAQDDLDKVTKMAYAQVKQFGFNETIGPLSYQEEGDLQVRPYSEALASVMDVEAKKLIVKAYNRTQNLLQDNKDKLEKLFHKLLEQETLTYIDVVKIIGPPAFEGKNLVNEVPFQDISTNSENKS